jgi:hypothetical protein
MFTAPATIPADVGAQAPDTVTPAPARKVTAPAPAPARTVRLVMGDKQALAILFPQKGHAEKVERLFDAIAPIVSTWLATGGNKTDFQQSATVRHGALVSALWDALATGKGTARKIGNAWAALAAHVLTIPGKSFAADQAGHDAAIEECAVLFMAFFPAPAVKEKDPTKETPAQQIARLSAENAALRIERDAMAAQLAHIGKAPAKVTALL